ncbi:MAG: hypothetical protein GXP51_06530 [Deltaproteobacteria bacterium]|nr:hypothetical protein [Deltaproteobacteria bacterium]
MISKKDHPKIELKEWIKVEGSDCVVSQVYGGYSLSGAGEVVTNPDEPINRDVFWTGQEWVFSERPTLFNATGSSRLKDFVAILQQQRNHPAKD